MKTKHLSFGSIAKTCLQKTGALLQWLLSFEEIRAIEQRKQKELYEAGIWRGM